jgi:ApbE superfamily uncharacterized protein (UPF0280 family)
VVDTPVSIADAKAWAIANGVSDGTNPGNAVSRQQLVTILYRAAFATIFTRFYGAVD